MRSLLVILMSVWLALPAFAQTPRSSHGFVDRLQAILPVFACLDEAPAAPTSLQRVQCLTAAGIAEEALQSDGIAPPAPEHLLPLAILFGGGEGAQFGLEVQARGLAYARCIEPRAAATTRAAGRSEASYRAAVAAILSPCHAMLPPDEMLLREDLPQTESATFLLGRAMGNLTIAYHARAGNWFPKALEPCIRYLDGRPPSPGCAGKPIPRAPAPPPQPRD